MSYPTCTVTDLVHITCLAQRCKLVFNAVFNAMRTLPDLTRIYLYQSFIKTAINIKHCYNCETRVCLICELRVCELRVCESASLRVASLRVASLRVASLRVASCESASCESASCESASCESASCESASCESASCESASCESASCESASCESASCESASCEFTVGIYCLENAHLSVILCALTN